MEILNKIFGTLMAGQMFHMRSAEHTRKVGYRGWARWHEYEAKEDFNTMMKLSKLMTDRAKIDFTINNTELLESHNYPMPSDLKAHHLFWIAREKEFCKLMKQAIDELKYSDVEIYKLIVAKLSDVQDEIARLEQLNTKLDNVSYSSSMLLLTSKELHEHFENETDRDYNA